MRVGINETRHTDPRKQFFHPRAPRIARALEAESHVLSNTEMRKQREILKHQAYGAPFGRHPEHRIADQLTIDPDLA